MMAPMGATCVLYVSVYLAIFSLISSTLVQQTINETNRKNPDETGYMSWPLAKGASLGRKENLPSGMQGNYIVINGPNLSWRKQLVWYYIQPYVEADIYNDDKTGFAFSRAVQFIGAMYLDRYCDPNFTVFMKFDLSGTGHFCIVNYLELFKQIFH